MSEGVQIDVEVSGVHLQVFVRAVGGEVTGVREVGAARPEVRDPSREMPRPSEMPRAVAAAKGKPASIIEEVNEARARHGLDNGAGSAKLATAMGVEKTTLGAIEAWIADNGSSIEALCLEAKRVVLPAKGGRR